MELESKINELKKINNKGKVLTIYLNTDRSECQSGSWQIRLKNGMKKLEEYIKLSSDDGELSDFKKLKGKVEKTFKNAKRSLQKSVVIFASMKDKLFSVQFLPVPVESDFSWEDLPKLNQLEEIQEKYPTGGVVVANEDEIILMHSGLGELDIVNQFAFDANTDDWRLFEGNASSDRVASSTNQRDAYNDRIEANQQRWIRSMIPLIREEAKKYHWHHVHIIGQAEYLSILEKELKLPIKSVLRKTVSNNEQKKMIYKEILAM